MSKRTQLLRSMKREREYNRSFEAGGEKLDMCIEALEKQIAKKPKKTGIEGYRYVDAYICPTCKGNFSGTRIADYCYHCGQKLDWSE